MINLQKKDDRFIYIQDKLALTYANQEVKAQLEEIWQNALEIPSRHLIVLFLCLVIIFKELATLAV